MRASPDLSKCSLELRKKLLRCMEYYNRVTDAYEREAALTMGRH